MKGAGKFVAFGTICCYPKHAPVPFIAWDPKKPDGQPRRMLDTSRARESFGFEAKASLEQGLSWTIRWFPRYSLSIIDTPK